MIASRLLQVNLANAYHLGKGIEKNHEKANQWWMEAAWQGHVQSMNLCVESRHEHVAYNKFGIFKPVVLYNGKVCGNWKMEGKGKQNKITTESFRYQSKTGKGKTEKETDRVRLFYQNQ